MHPLTMDPDPLNDVHTFRGRSLEEVLPQVRERLGPDAIVVRRREGLAGGVGGFFQRPYVEVDARPPNGKESPGVPRNDRATVEGLASPAIQALLQQASPFASALAEAGARRPQPPDPQPDVLVDPPEGPRSPGLYGPQPNLGALAASAAGFVPEPQPAHEPRAAEPPPAAERAPAPEPPRAPEPPPAPAPEPEPLPAAAPAPVPAAAAPEPEPAPAAEMPTAASPPEAPAAAAELEARLARGGLSPALAADLVGEAVAHGLPFAEPDALDELVRTALARRLHGLAHLGAGPRRVAVVGAGGAGKSRAVAHLAAAYAEAGARVAVVALRSTDGGRELAERLGPLGITVISTTDAEEAAGRLARLTAELVVIDTPAAGPGEPTIVEALAADLRTLDAAEVHVALPATLSAAAAEEQSEALDVLGLTHVLLTHADQTARPGAALEAAVGTGRMLSYVATRDRVRPADPFEIARRLLP
jgi:flagellar biosynthesis GTPase FlhF